MSTTDKVLPVRTVGVEIECFYEDRGTNHDIIEKPVRVHGARIDGDGSIEPRDSDQCAREIKTAPLSGAAFHESVIAITDALEKAGAETNRSCGLHVHVDARELDIRGAIVPHVDSQLARQLLYTTTSVDNPPAEGFVKLFVSQEALQKLGVDVHDGLKPARLFSILSNNVSTFGLTDMAVAPWGEGYRLRGDRTIQEVNANTHDTMAVFYVDHEKLREVPQTLHNLINVLSAADTVVRSLIPASRRLNSFCNPIAKAIPAGGCNPRPYDEVLQSVGTRYLGFNLMSLNAHGTVECRYHGGTVDGDKIRHWALFIERLINLGLSDSADTNAQALNAFVQTKDRFECLLSLLGLPQETESYLRERYSRHARASSSLLKRTVEHNKACNAPAQPFTRSLATAS